MRQRDMTGTVHQVGQLSYAPHQAGNLGEAAASGEGDGELELKCKWNLQGKVSGRHVETLTWSLEDNWVMDFDLGTLNIQVVVGNM